MRKHTEFPFLFGGTFIEGARNLDALPLLRDFPSFSEGLSLRAPIFSTFTHTATTFPFLFGGTFIEGSPKLVPHGYTPLAFPFLFGGTFIEGPLHRRRVRPQQDFPSFSEGLSLRDAAGIRKDPPTYDFPSFSEGLSLRGDNRAHRNAAWQQISLPFRRDFH